jgi:hypothetical protein
MYNYFIIVNRNYVENKGCCAKDFVEALVEEFQNISNDRKNLVSFDEVSGSNILIKFTEAVEWGVVMGSFQRTIDLRCNQNSLEEPKLEVISEDDALSLFNPANLEDIR